MIFCIITALVLLYNCFYFIKYYTPNQEGNTMTATVTLPSTKRYPHKRIWNLDYIWQASESLEEGIIDVDSLWENRYSKAWCWQHNDEIINNEFFLHHLERVMNADLTYPIILSEENYILDGVHRLMKAKYLGYAGIKFVKFKKDPITDVS